MNIEAKTITAIAQAFADINKEGVPPRREHRRYLAKIGNLTVPVKLLYEKAFNTPYNTFTTIDAQKVLSDYGVEIVDIKKKKDEK